MKSATPIIALALAVLASLVVATPVEKRAMLKGIDVASYQRNVDWAAQKRAGVTFAYVKATEGTSYRNPYFDQQYIGSYKVGIIRGAYHFARPDKSSGVAQADYFLEHGGGWSADGKTLPGMLDMESGPHSKCHGLSAARMVSWIKSFSDHYHAKTGRYPTIYTSLDWWKTCTGNTAAFGKTNPLDIAHYSPSVGTLPAGWTHWTFWQYKVVNNLDYDYFNGDAAALARFAKGS
ncbi:hypothetical protein FRC08_002824 [Ceratobasidium sp. 394]|nr:hypothetical protein FRC08_002824 [Ceratobasidium sp. 394]KAG9074914.1 hypothetical protein FS749_013480 [Ceratobasidium sp. UAMH 11750]